MFFVMVILTILAPQACAQRKVVSDYNYQKAVEAYYKEDDDSKALNLLNEMLDEAPNHFDSRFLRAKIFRRAEKYDNALRDVNYAIKNYKGKPSLFKVTFILLVLVCFIFLNHTRQGENVFINMLSFLLCGR